METETASPEASEAQHVRRPRTVQVIGLTNDIESDHLELYFESKRQSGGGPVQGVVLSGGSALITFDDCDDALRVAQKLDHSLLNVPLTLVLLDTWPESITQAIRVSGISQETTEETVEIFFENPRRSGGGAIEEILSDRENGTAVITFESREVAGRVASRNDLSLNSVRLSVEWLKPGRPPPLCLDTSKVSAECLLFVDLPTNVQPEYLRKYASDAGGVSVTEITYSPQPGIALINYSSPPDYKRVQMAVCSKPCCGQMISVQRLPLTTSVQVHNIGAMSLESLELFFENEKRSGGGTIVNSESGNGYYILEFEDARVMKRVVNRKHEFIGQHLKVYPYFPTFGVLPLGFDSSRPLLVLPSDVSMDCCPGKIHFISINKQLRHKIEETLKAHSCRIKWPATHKQKLVLHCTVNPQHPDAFVRIQNWSNRCTEQMQKELDTMGLLKEKVPLEIWKQLKEKVTTQIQCNPEQIIVHYDDADAVIHACGLCSLVDKYLKVIVKVRTELEEELEKSKRCVTESVLFNPHQLFLLGTLDIISTYGTHELDIKLTNNAVVLVGHSQDILKVKLELWHKASCIISSSLDQMSPALMKILSKPACKSYVHSLFANSQLKVTFDIQNGEVRIHGFEQHDVHLATSILKSAVSKRNIELQCAYQDSMCSRQLSMFLAGLTQQFQLTNVCILGSFIQIIGIRDECQAVEDKIQDFLNTTVFTEKFVTVPAGIVKVLKNYGESHVDNLCQELGLAEGAIRFQVEPRSGCLLRMPLTTFPIAQQRVTLLVESVVKQNYDLQPHYVELWKTMTTRLFVEGIAIRNKVVIHFPDDEGHDFQSRCSLSIYGLSSHPIDSTIQDLKSMHDESKITKQLTSDEVKQFIREKLTLHQELKINLLQIQHNVDIKISREPEEVSMIALSGNADDVYTVVQEIYFMLKEA